MTEKTPFRKRRRGITALDREMLATLGATLIPPVDVKGSAWGFDPWDRIAEAADRVLRGNPKGKR